MTVPQMVILAILVATTALFLWPSATHESRLSTSWGSSWGIMSATLRLRQWGNTSRSSMTIWSGALVFASLGRCSLM